MLRTQLRSVAVCLAACAVSLLSACGGPFACTEIGCQDQVRLDVFGPGGEARSQFEGSVTIAGVTRSFVCPGGTGNDAAFIACSAGGVTLFDVDATAAQLTADVTSGSDTFSGTLPIGGLTESQPNGPGCPPICRSASAQLTF